MCCLIDGSPVEDSRGRYKNYMGPNEFQTPMMNAPCVDCPRSCCWFLGQFCPWTCGCTQYALRKKALGGDMTRYSCFQGYFNCCCIKAGSCGEKDCPEFCLFCESCFCNSMAISATRSMVIDQYQLHMDPCDYRLIRINNCLQCFACLCDIAALLMPELREIARCIDHVADLFYHTVSGCMTAQVAHEINYQLGLINSGQGAKNVQNFAPQQPQYAPQQPQYAPQQPQYAPQQPPYAPQQPQYGQQQPQYGQQQPQYGQQQQQQQQYPQQAYSYPPGQPGPNPKGY